MDCFGALRLAMTGWRGRGWDFLVVGVSGGVRWVGVSQSRLIEVVDGGLRRHDG
jgi:hypothetical protein